MNDAKCAAEHGNAEEQSDAGCGGNVVYEYESLTPTQGTVYVYGVNLISSRNNSDVEKFYLYNAHGDVVQLIDEDGEVLRRYKYDAFGNEKEPDANDTNYFRYAGQCFDIESGTYYLRARYYNPKNGRFTSEDTHWNINNMIYGDQAVKMAHGVLMPDIYAIMQSSNLYVYCGGNPLMFVDPTGEAWYHWAIGGLIVAGAAALTIITAGGALPAMAAVGAVASGAAATTAGATIAASAFIGAATVYGGAALFAAMDSKTIKEFNDKGNWGTVIYTAVGAGLGGLVGYVATRGTESKNIFTDKRYTNTSSTGVSNFQSDKTGMNAARADFNALKPTNVRTYSTSSGTTTVGNLPDGRTVNIHAGKSVGGAPTLEIFDPVTSERIKIRY